MRSALGSSVPLGSFLPIAVNGPFEDTPWFGRLLGWILAVILLIAIFAWIVFAPIDLYRREDIGLLKKLLWLAAFVLSAGIVLIVYGAVRFSRTDGHPGW